MKIRCDKHTTERGSKHGTYVTKGFLFETHAVVICVCNFNVVGLVTLNVCTPPDENVAGASPT